MNKKKKRYNRKEEQAFIAVIVLVLVLAMIGLGTVVRLIVGSIRNAVTLRPAEPTDEAQEQTESVVVYEAPATAEDAETAYLMEEYTEGDGPAPEWYRPDEPMSAVWEDHFPDAAKMVDGDNVTDINVGGINVLCNAQQSDTVDYIAHPPIGIDPGGVDWNLCTTVWGWDGHGAEAWELDLLARVFYLEFWGTSLPCSEAGCDAILNLWDSGKYGRSLFDALSYYDPDYGYTYRVYPKVWQTDYDADGLAWCKDFCMERFLNGPEWSAVYFQLGGYHDTDWVPPLYEMDGVYFSGKSGGWE